MLFIYNLDNCLSVFDMKPFSQQQNTCPVDTCHICDLWSLVINDVFWKVSNFSLQLLIVEAEMTAGALRLYQL